MKQWTAPGLAVSQMPVSTSDGRGDTVRQTNAEVEARDRERQRGTVAPEGFVEPKDHAGWDPDLESLTPRPPKWQHG